MRGEKRHSVQKSSYYSFVSTVLLAIMLVHGRNGIVKQVMSRVIVVVTIDYMYSLLKDVFYYHTSSVLSLSSALVLFF